MRALGRGVAAPDEAGGLDLVLLPDLCGGARRRRRACVRRGVESARSFARSEVVCALGRRGGGVGRGAKHAVRVSADVSCS